MTTTNATATHFIVKSSSSKMPGTCWGTYRHVAVLEVDAGVTYVTMISERARGVVRIIEESGACSVGKTDRCAYAKALAAARSLCDKLNAAKIDCTNSIR